MTTLSQKISERLVQDIVGGALRPGTKLEETALADRFRVSRSPIRDALRQLAATGLLEFQPRRGFSVVSIDVAGLLDLFEAASEVEGLLAKLCAMRVGMAEKRQLLLIHKRSKEAVARRDAKAYAALNEEFHQALYAGARNSTLRAVAMNLRHRLAPFRSQDFFSTANRMQSSLAEHERITQAISSADGEAAFEAVREHTANSATNVIEFFERESAKRPARRR
jgi:DNA-binding GntR family transcriptional regulator